MEGVNDGDLGLIRCLLEHPRASYADLARKTGISETKARRRVEALIESKVITPAIIPDVRRLGYQTMALIGIKVDPNHIEETAEAISSMHHVTSIHMTLGRYDLIATIADRTLDDLSNTISNDIATLPGIRDVETFVSTRALKILRHWRMPEDMGLVPGSPEAAE